MNIEGIRQSWVAIQDDDDNGVLDYMTSDEFRTWRDIIAPLCDEIERVAAVKADIITALNDYAVEIPWSDLLRYNPCWPTGATASEWAFATRGR